MTLFLKVKLWFVHSFINPKTLNESLLYAKYRQCAGIVPSLHVFTI